MTNTKLGDIAPATPSSTAPSSTAPPSAAPSNAPVPPAPPAAKSEDRTPRLSLAFIVVMATWLHQNLLFATSPEPPEDLEIAGYVLATAVVALVAQYIAVGIAYFRPKSLPTAIFAAFGLGLIAQAACPIDGHVSATAPVFMLQVVSWLAYGLVGIWALSRTRTA